jgi:GT2 family glycosyltransferase
MYAEDMDFCARANDRGLKVVHLPSARVTHEVGASSNGSSTLWIDNLEDFYIQRFHPTRAALYGWRLTFTLGLATRSLAYRLRAAMRRAEADVWMNQAHIFDAFARRSLRRRGSGA